jgi:hypothetical protein
LRAAYPDRPEISGCWHTTATGRKSCRTNGKAYAPGVRFVDLGPSPPDNSWCLRPRRRCQGLGIAFWHALSKVRAAHWFCCVKLMLGKHFVRSMPSHSKRNF